MNDTAPVAPTNEPPTEPPEERESLGPVGRVANPQFPEATTVSGALHRLFLPLESETQTFEKLQTYQPIHFVTSEHFLS